MTDDQKPMSAEDKAKEIMGPVIDWATSRPIQSFSDTAGAQAIDVLTDAVEAIATALRDHAAEAVEAEREENAKIADRVSIKSSAMRSLDAKGRCDAADEIATDIRARTEGGEGDG